MESSSYRSFWGEFTAIFAFPSVDLSIDQTEFKILSYRPTKLGWDVYYMANKDNLIFNVIDFY